MMAHSLTVTSAAAAAATASTALSGKGKSQIKSNASSSCSSSSFPIPKVWAAPHAAHHNRHASPSDEDIPHHHRLSPHRRALMVGLSMVSGSILLGLGWNEESQNASAAARRPPPPPPEEKKDPNVSGVQAKVLASKKRKEALKQSVAKMREKGKPIENPSQ